MRWRRSASPISTCRSPRRRSGARCRRSADRLVSMLTTDRVAGGTLHLAMELLSHAAGVKLRHVPYAGAGPALTAILGGHVDALASGPAVVLPHIKAGKLRALAGWGDRRVAALPEVPTFKELGYPDAEFYIWAGVFAGKGT